MKKITTLLLSILLANAAQAQFQWTIGGTNDDEARSIIQATDGGYAAAGYTSSFGTGGDMYIVKLDASGTLQWSKTIGGTNYDGAGSIIQTTDDGYAAAGWTTSFGAGSYDFYIVKLDGSGTLQWSRTVGGTGDDINNSIIQTTDGGYAVGGWTESFGAGDRDVYIVKLDASGTLQWIKTIGGTNFDEAYSIIQTTDGGYAVAGTTESFGAGYRDFYLVKLDGSGTLQWSRTVGGTGVDRAFPIIQTTDGGYAVAGHTDSFGAGQQDFYIVKLDGSGTLQWSRTVGGTGVDEAYSIIQTTDGGYAAAGYTTSFGAGLNDFYIVKLDTSGTLQWSRTVGGTGNDAYEYKMSIVQTTDGGYAAASISNSFGAGGYDMYIVKFDSSGNTCGNSTSPTSTVTTPTSIVNSGGTVTTPTSTVTTPSPTVSTGGTVTTMCTTVGIQPISNELPEIFRLEQNYPNPFSGSTVISFSLSQSQKVSLKIFDVNGRLVTTLADKIFDAGENEIIWNAGEVNSGVYFLRMETANYSENRKLIVTK